MKLIFLDIDGVLNGHRAHGNGYCGIESENANRLNQILNSTNALIVISSAWRYLHVAGEVTKKGFESLLLTHGVDAKGRVLGFTESDEATLQRIKGTTLNSVREHQIQEYLNRTKVDRFVVLDDLPLAIENFVQTDGAKGIQDADVLKVLAILERTK